MDTGFSPSAQTGTLRHCATTSFKVHLRSGRLQEKQQPAVLIGFSPVAQVSLFFRQFKNSSLVHLSAAAGGVNFLLQVGQQVSVLKDGLSPSLQAGRSSYFVAQAVLKPRLSDGSPQADAGGLQDTQQFGVRTGRSPEVQVGNSGQAALQSCRCLSVHLVRGILQVKQPLSLRSGLVPSAQSAGAGQSGSSLVGLENLQEGQQVSKSNLGRVSAAQLGRAEKSHAFT